MEPRGTPAHAFRGRRVTVATAGFDPDLQGIGGGPTSSPLVATSGGIRLLPTPPTTASERYLVLLAFYSLGFGQRARIVGMRQYLSIGTHTTSGPGAAEYPIELPITSPFWRFVNGNARWGLRTMPGGPGNFQVTASTFNSTTMQFRYGESPVTLFETPPGSVKGYTPPNRGAFWGQVIKGIEPLGSFSDLRFPWRDTMPLGTLDAEIDGPCDLLFQASVLQTAVGGRPAITLPGTLVGGDGGLPPEERFVATFPSAVYWRIAGSFDLEIEDTLPLRGDEPFDSCTPRGPA